MALKTRGVPQTKKGIKDAIKRLNMAAKSAIDGAATSVMETSRANTPEDTGNLKRSMYVSRPKTSGRRSLISLEAGYGAEYAVEVHERTEFRHANGSSKFLEMALMAAGRETLIQASNQASLAFKSGKPVYKRVFTTKPRKGTR